MARPERAFATCFARRRGVAVLRSLIPTVLTAAGLFLAGLLLLAGLAPGYLTERGFPLDDAWIHLTYGRSVAREWAFAYNPGEPATGATSLLWAALLAIPHWVAGEASQIALLTKTLGLALHAAGAAWLARALAPQDRPAALVVGAAVFIGLNAALVGASVSGMEVALSTCLVAAVVASAQRGSLPVVVLASTLAVLARPELAVLCLLLTPALAWARDRSPVRVTLASAGGVALAAAVMAARNLAVTGRPLPATFYAKVGPSPLGAFESQRRGFVDLLAQLPFAEPLVLVAGVALAVWAIPRVRSDRSLAVPAAAVLAALAYFALSFALVAPFDPFAFYHQRYALPSLPLWLGGTFWLAARLLSTLPPPRLRPAIALAATLGVLLQLVGTSVPALALLENDAHNIDDVQVQVGRALADVPADRAVWAVDAGGVRYFGQAYVVDTLGLNTPQLLTDEAPDYLRAHPPTFLELVPTWSDIDGLSRAHVTAERVFRPSTDYTVTSYEAMQTHVLVGCGAGGRGEFVIRGRALAFECAADRPAAQAGAQP